MKLVVNQYYSESMKVGVGALRSAYIVRLFVLGSFNSVLGLELLSS